MELNVITKCVWEADYVLRLSKTFDCEGRDNVQRVAFHTLTTLPHSQILPNPLHITYSSQSAEKGLPSISQSLYFSKHAAPST